MLVLYKIFRQYPKGLRLSFPRLKEKLEDDDAGIRLGFCHQLSYICVCCLSRSISYFYVLNFKRDLLFRSLRCLIYVSASSMGLGVVSASVNVICELARKNPVNYLSLAPVLYKLLTTSSNNWMLIKIVKLVGHM